MTVPLLQMLMMNLSPNLTVPCTTQSSLEKTSPHLVVVHHLGVEALCFKTIVDVSARAKEHLGLGLIDVDLLRCLGEVLWGDSKQLLHHPLL
jgi:hypothetical protein